MPFDPISYSLAKKLGGGLSWEEIKALLQSEGALNKQYDPDLDGKISTADIVFDSDLIPTDDKAYQIGTFQPGNIKRLLRISTNHIYCVCDDDVYDTVLAIADTTGVGWGFRHYGSSYSGAGGSPNDLELYFTDFTGEYPAIRIPKQNDIYLQRNVYIGSVYNFVPEEIPGEVYTYNLTLKSTTPSETNEFIKFTYTPTIETAIILYRDTYPDADESLNFGLSNKKWSNIYTKKLHCIGPDSYYDDLLNIGDTSNASWRFRYVGANYVPAPGDLLVDPGTLTLYYDTGAGVQAAIEFIPGNMTKSYMDFMPSMDNDLDIGSSSSRWANIYAVNVYTGDLNFEEKTCAVCGEPFEEDDELILKVKKVDNYTRTVPIHLKCSKAYKELVEKLGGE